MFFSLFFLLLLLFFLNCSKNASIKKHTYLWILEECELRRRKCVCVCVYEEHFSVSEIKEMREFLMCEFLMCELLFMLLRTFFLPQFYCYLWSYGMFILCILYKNISMCVCICVCNNRLFVMSVNVRWFDVLIE